MTEYSFRDYLKENWQFEVRCLCGGLWGIMPAVVGVLITNRHPYTGILMVVGGMGWAILFAWATRPRCFG